MKSKVMLLALAGIALTTAGAGAWWWQAGQAQMQVAALLPSAPDLSAAPSALRDRVATTEARARSRLSALKGFAELSRVYHANGFFDEAGRCYQGLQQLQSTEPRWLHLHATILAGYGENQSALELWKKVRELAPDYLPAHLRSGDSLLKSNRSQEAAAAYEAALKLDRDNPYALLGLARLDLEAERWDKARTRLEQVVSKTNYQLGYDLIVSLYERMGLTQRATAIRAMAKAFGSYRDPADPWLDGLVEDCLDPYRLSLAAGSVARNGDAATALRLLERAVEVAPEDVSVRFQFGTLLVEQGRLDDAQAQLERCTALAPDFADGWAHLSSLLVRLGRTTAADRVLAEGLKSCPQSPGLHLMHARNLQRNGKTGEAIQEYQKSIELRPNEADAYLELANVYATQGREAEALREMSRALAAEPGNTIALGILAYHAITTGSKDEAQLWLARVRNQPRIENDQLNRLLAAYQQRFGRAP